MLLRTKALTKETDNQICKLKLTVFKQFCHICQLQLTSHTLGSLHGDHKLLSSECNLFEINYYKTISCHDDFLNNVSRSSFLEL